MPQPLATAGQPPLPQVEVRSSDWDLPQGAGKPYHRTSFGALYLDDCLEWLRMIRSETIDLVIADPPYNINKAEWDTFESQQHYVDWCVEWIKECRRILKPIGTMYICGFSEIVADVKFAAAPLFAGCKWLIWYYRNKANMGQGWGRSHESLLHFRVSREFTFNIDDVRVPYNQHTLKYRDHPQASSSQYGNGKEYVWRPNPLGAKPRDVFEIPTLCNATEEKKEHPTQKPFELIRKLVLASSNEGDVVLDPFGGAGTTYVACELLRRRWLGCEINEDYCEITKQRLLNPIASLGEWARLSDAELQARRARLRHGR